MASNKGPSKVFEPGNEEKKSARDKDPAPFEGPSFKKTIGRSAREDADKTSSK